MLYRNKNADANIFLGYDDHSAPVVYATDCKQGKQNSQFIYFIKCLLKILNLKFWPPFRETKMVFNHF